MEKDTRSSVRFDFDWSITEDGVCEADVTRSEWPGLIVSKPTNVSEFEVTISKTTFAIRPKKGKKFFAKIDQHEYDRLHNIAKMYYSAINNIAIVSVWDHVRKN